MKTLNSILKLVFAIAISSTLICTTTTAFAITGQCRCKDDTSVNLNTDHSKCSNECNQHQGSNGLDPTFP